VEGRSRQQRRGGCLGTDPGLSTAAGTDAAWGSLTTSPEMSNHLGLVSGLGEKMEGEYLSHC
jgi:hypothetical protein